MAASLALPRPLERERERERLRDLERERDPLTTRFVARPASVDSRIWRLECLSGFRSTMPSVPPAASAAVRTRFPLAPDHSPGSLRARNASIAPAARAALTAWAMRASLLSRWWW